MLEDNTHTLSHETLHADAKGVPPSADADISDLRKVHFDTIASRLDDALYDYKELVKRLYNDLDTAHDKLTIATDEIKNLLAINKALQGGLDSIKQTASPVHVETNQSNTALESGSYASTIGPVIFKNDTNSNGPAEEEDVKELNVETMVMNIATRGELCDISHMYYKTEWVFSELNPPKVMGWILSATVLKQMPGLCNIDENMLMDKSLRCLHKNAMDAKGNSIGGYFVLNDIAYAIIFKNMSNARTWSKNINQVNNVIAPSLTYIPSHNARGGVLAVVSYVDALKLIVRHHKMNVVPFGDITTYLGSVHYTGSDSGEDPETLQNCGPKKRIMQHIDNAIAECDAVSTSMYKKMKQEITCSCGKPIICCNLHGGSALCVICKDARYISDHDKHCASCFVYKFPTDVRSQCHVIRPEDLVRAAISISFEGFIHNKSIPIMGNFHARKIDHRLLIENTILAVETDENAHQNYNKYDENYVRYNDFVSELPYKFIFIRFNPDANMENFNAKTDIRHKLCVLMHTITAQINRVRQGRNTQKLEILKLFYS